MWKHLQQGLKFSAQGVKGQNIVFLYSFQGFKIEA